MKNIKTNVTRRNALKGLGAGVGTLAATGLLPGAMGFAQAQSSAPIKIGFQKRFCVPVRIFRRLSIQNEPERSNGQSWTREAAEAEPIVPTECQKAQPHVKISGLEAFLD